MKIGAGIRRGGSKRYKFFSAARSSAPEAAQVLRCLLRLLLGLHFDCFFCANFWLVQLASP